MTSALQRLKQHSSIVADTGDIEAIKKHQPEDATTNPSLLLKASEIEAYKPYLDKAWSYAKETEQDAAKQLELACDYFAVLLGKEISEIVPGYISTEVDARLSFDTQATIDKAESKKKKIDIHPKHEVTAKQKIKTNLVFIFTVCIRS